MGMFIRTGAVGLIILGLLAGMATDIGAVRNDQDNATGRMRLLLKSLAGALPQSLNLENFRHPDQKPVISKALNTLVENAEDLESHGRMDDERFNFLRRALVRDAHAAARAYEQEEYEHARIFLHQLTENCFSCHIRLPGKNNETFGLRFMKEMDLADLPLDHRARMEVVTRRFDDAMNTYEEMLELPVWYEPYIGFDGAFENYLKIALRVRGDYEQPVPTLEAFMKRDDAPWYLTVPAEAWIKALKTIQKQTPADDPIQYARTMIREGQLRTMFPKDRQGMIHFIAASSALHRYVDAEPTDRRRLAEAYYLLAVAESHISDTAWVSETEFFLQNAVRLAPEAPFAKRAYALLEEYMMMQYEGVLGTPPEVWDYLEDLRSAIER